MTKPINDGGPAFPFEYFANSGMKLRDYFAGQILSGLILDPQLGQDIQTVVTSAYKVADAMLKAREVQS